MNDSWIKLYRKTTENDILKDHSAWAVFTWLLLMVDRNTGKRTIGRFQMSDELGIKPNTLYKILHRLEKKWKVISLVSQMKFTEISILNWTKYQMTVNDRSNDSQMTVKRQSSASNTKQEVENIRIKEEENIQPKISNSLNLTKGQLMAYAKQFKGITTTEIKEQQDKCNSYMNMSSANYTNPGLFFKGWLERYLRERTEKENKKDTIQKINESLPVISEEQRLRNLAKLSEIRAKIGRTMN